MLALLLRFGFCLLGQILGDSGGLALSIVCGEFRRKNPGWLLSIKVGDVDAIPTERCATPVFSLSHHRLPPTMADLRTVNELIAGSVGGAAQVLVGQPLDTIKTRAQIAPRECWLNLIPRRRLITCGFASQGTCLYASSRLLRWEVDWGTQKGPMDVFLQTVRKEGALGLYKGIIYRVYMKSVSHPFLGMLSPLLGIAGVNSLLFASYGLSKRIVTPFGELSLPQIALAGAMAGAANAVLASPGEISVL